MMDIKEIIKWFIPCFHILRKNRSFSHRNNLNTFLLSLFCFLLFFNFSSGLVVRSKSDMDFFTNDSKYEGSNEQNGENITEERHLDNISTGRTFGRPFKKMMAGLLPIIFQMGAATTWAAIATVIGFKTLLVSLTILKLLLIAGAAKIGALFAAKGYHQKEHGWSPNKEIHLHIHNGGHHSPPEEHYTSWSREGITAGTENKAAIAYSPYAQPQPLSQPYSGPQAISTPYGNYVKVDESLSIQKRDVNPNPS